MVFENQVTSLTERRIRLTGQPGSFFKVELVILLMKSH